MPAGSAAGNSKRHCVVSTPFQRSFVTVHKTGDSLLYRGCQRTVSAPTLQIDCVWNVMAHGDARKGNWRGNGRMEWAASTLRTTSEHGVSNITAADAHTSAASSRLNWRPRRFKWTRPFRRKTKYVFCACAITFQLASATSMLLHASHVALLT
jgi:hypothetical protein